MNTGSILILAFAVGVIAGLRSMTALAVISWAAYLGWFNLQHSFLAFLGSTAASLITTVLAIGEIVADKLPKTPSRKAPIPFIARICLGAFAGCALCLAANRSAIAGALMGGIGAIVGTLVGYELRRRLVRALNVPDVVIAVLEDVAAIAGGFFIVSRG